MNYNKLNEILYDENNIIWYLKVESHSLLEQETQFKFSFNDGGSFQDDLTHDIYHVLESLEDNSLDDAISKVEKQLEVKEELLNKYLTGDDSSNINVAEEIHKLNNSQLVALLNKYNIKSSGKKKKLVNLAIKNIPAHEFGSKNYEINSAGEKFLKEHEWIRYYDKTLTSFDFNDFSKFISENDGEYYQLVFDFIDKHLKLARKNENFIYYEKCMEAISLNYLSQKDYQNCLNSELKRFIFRMNPQYYSYIDYYPEYLIFNPENVFYIKALINELEITNIEDMFYKMWDELNLKKEFVSKDIAFDYFSNSIENEADLDDLTSEYDEKYFSIAKEYFDLSLYYYHNHDFLISSEFFEFAIENDPTCIESLYYEALSFIHYRDFEMANSRIDEVLEKDSNNAKYLNVKAIVLFENNEIEESKKCFKKALDLNSDDSKILNTIGVCYARFGNVDKAMEYFDKAISFSKDYIRPILNKAKLFIDSTQFDKADECFNEVEEISSIDKNYLIDKACYLLIKKDFDNALDILNLYLDTYPDLAMILHLKHMCLNELGYNEEYKKYLDNLSRYDKLSFDKLEKYLNS